MGICCPVKERLQTSPQGPALPPRGTMRAQPGRSWLPRVGDVRLGSVHDFATRSLPTTQEADEEGEEIQRLDRPVVKAGLCERQSGG